MLLYFSGKWGQSHRILKPLLRAPLAPKRKWLQLLRRNAWRFNIIPDTHLPHISSYHTLLWLESHRNLQATQAQIHHHSCELRVQNEKFPGSTGTTSWCVGSPKASHATHWNPDIADGSTESLSKPQQGSTVKLNMLLMKVQIKREAKWMSNLQLVVQLSINLSQNLTQLANPQS